MKFSNLPRLIFKTRHGVCNLLVAPPVGAVVSCFYVRQSANCVPLLGGSACPLDGGAAFAFFASQISLEDYHAPA